MRSPETAGTGAWVGRVETSSAGALGGSGSAGIDPARLSRSARTLAGRCLLANENRSGTPRAASAGPTKHPNIALQIYPSLMRRRIWP